MPEGRNTALRYVAGIATVQVGWLLRMLIAETGALPPASSVPVFIGLDLLELAVPPWAERRGPTSWHPQHIAERYGLFTIILLGESVLAASTGVERALQSGRVSVSLVIVAISGLILLFSLWWLYFLESVGDELTRNRNRAYLWGYGSYGVFIALAALGAGLEVAVETTDRPANITAVEIGFAVAIPVAAFLVFVCAIHALIVSRRTIRPAVILSAAVAVLMLAIATAAAGPAITVTAIAAVCALVVALTISQGRSTTAHRHPTAAQQEIPVSVVKSRFSSAVRTYPTPHIPSD